VIKRKGGPAGLCQKERVYYPFKAKGGKKRWGTGADKKRGEKVKGWGKGGKDAAVQAKKWKRKGEKGEVKCCVPALIN